MSYKISVHELLLGNELTTSELADWLIQYNPKLWCIILKYNRTTKEKVEFT